MESAQPCEGPFAVDLSVVGEGVHVVIGRDPFQVTEELGDRHLAEALASLEAVSVRELEATAEALERRRDGLRGFAGIFRNVAHARVGGWDTDLPRFHLGQAVRADEEFSEQIEDASAPFWRHVREALRAY